MNLLRLMSPRLGFVLFALVLLVGSPAMASSLVVAIGDSNTAGFGVPGAQKYPAKLQATLRARDAAFGDGRARVKGPEKRDADGRLIADD